jgi:molybdate transport system permease protein
MIVSKCAQWASYLLAIFIVTIIGSAFFKTDNNAIASLFTESGFGQALLFSLKTSFAATFIAAIIGIPAGLYLARKNSLAATVIDALFDIPIVIPPVVAGVLLLSFFNLALIKQFYDVIFTVHGAIIAQFIVAVPYTIRASKNAFELVPQIYERIAMTLGARPVKAFMDTTFTLALPAVLSGLILSWLRCLGEFGATLMVGGGIPGRTENIPIYIYLNMSSGEFDKGMAASIVAILCAFVGVLFIRYFTNPKKV